MGNIKTLEFALMLHKYTDMFNLGFYSKCLKPFFCQIKSKTMTAARLNVTCSYCSLSLRIVVNTVC